MRSALATPRGQDAVLAALLAGAALVETGRGSAGVSPVLYALALATTVPLGWRWRAPVVVGLTVQAVFAAATVWVVPAESLAQGVAVYLVATYTAALGPRAWTGAAACGVTSAVLLAGQGLLDPRYSPAGAAMANVVYVLMAWGVAGAVRVHRQRSVAAAAAAELAVASAERQAAEAVRAERARVSAELHDVVAHALSVVVLRARGGLHEHALDPAAGAEALRDVAEVAARALGDMRRLLAIVGAEEDRAVLEPQPGLGDLPALVEQVRAAGLRTQLVVRGEGRELSAGLALSTYRVVQESLTNALRHTEDGSAEVVLTWQSDALVVEVTSSGTSRPSPGSGQGLIGLRERVALFGGTLQAGAEEAGFRVRALLPVPT